MSARFRRRQYLVDKNFQVKFIFNFCVIVIISSLAIGALVFFLSRNSTTVAIENTKVTVKSTADFILPMLSLIVGVSAVFFSLVLGVLALVVSHRIVGPLYRLRRDIDMLKEGDFTKQFQVRNKDQLKDLAKSLGSMSLALREKHSELKKKSDSLRDFLKQRNFCVAFVICIKL